MKPSVNKWAIIAFTTADGGTFYGLRHEYGTFWALVVAIAIGVLFCKNIKYSDKPEPKEPREPDPLSDAPFDLPHPGARVLSNRRNRQP